MALFPFKKKHIVPLERDRVRFVEFAGNQCMEDITDGMELDSIALHSLTFTESKIKIKGNGGMVAWTCESITRTTRILHFH